MPRFYLPSAGWKPETLTLDHAESHHALVVMRMGKGDRIVVFNGVGREATVEITDTTRGRVTGRILGQHDSTPLACEITLGQAVPKGKTMDLIIEKATELGASCIIPIISERTVVRVDDDKDAGGKQLKWQRVAVEAAKQCGQNWLPKVAAPVAAREFFSSSLKFDLALVASLQPDARSVREVLSEVAAGRPGWKPRNVLILVGPEGDFTPAEMAEAKTAGCRPITLGPIILRSETAALYSLSV